MSYKFEQFKCCTHEWINFSCCVIVNVVTFEQNHADIKIDKCCMIRLLKTRLPSEVSNYVGM